MSNLGPTLVSGRAFLNIPAITCGNKSVSRTDVFGKKFKMFYAKKFTLAVSEPNFGPCGFEFSPELDHRLDRLAND